MKLNNKGVFFISQLYGSFESSTKNRVYFDLESKLESAAIKYINTKGIKVTGEYKISYETLKNEGYIDSIADSNGNGCNGYVLVSKNNELTNNYQGYILCNNYQTKNY